MTNSNSATMKQHILYCLLGLFLWAGCNDDDNFIPNESVIQAFNAKYPSATQVEWEAQSSYLTVEFMDHHLSNTAWFDQTGQWFMTQTEFNRLELLPAEVLAAFQSSTYAHWTTDDIDRLERRDSKTIYIIEVKQGNEEYDLYYSEDGLLKKALADKDNDDDDVYLPHPLPAAITEFLNGKYPGARLVDIEQEQGITEVDIIHENRSMEVIFDAHNEWLSTHYDVTIDDIEHTVTEALNNSEYKSYFINDIEKYETLSENYYLFELEKNETEVELRIDMNGKLTLIKTEK